MFYFYPTPLLFTFIIFIIFNINKIIQTWSFWCQLFVVRTNDVGRSVLSTIHNSVNEYKKLVSNCTNVYMAYIYIHKARHTINNNNNDNNNDHNNNNDNMLFLLCI